jgi:zinc transporter 1/2/3
MSLTSLKLVLLLLTLAVGWIGAALPLLRERKAVGGGWVGVGNAFAAGLFLGVGLLHFLPEATAGFEARGAEFPLAPALALAAFLLLLLLEHVLLPDAAHDAAHSHSGEGLGGAHVHSSAHLGTSHGHADPHEATVVSASASPYVLVFALSAHSVLAGLALGADPDRVGTLLSFLAIAVHKGTAGLALGMALATSAIGKRRGLWMAALFALMTPLGIGVGMVAGGPLQLGARIAFEAGVSALAAGTFLYIGAFDLLQDEFLRPGRRWAKWVSAAAGVLLAALLAGSA